MCVQIVRMLATWTNHPTSFISCVRCLLKTEVCICTDVGRMFSEQAPAGSSVRGEACLGGVEMFSSTLLCSRWGTLVRCGGELAPGLQTLSTDGPQFSTTVKHYRR